MTRINYEGSLCKGCGEIINVYSGSGYCRNCWHMKRTGITNSNDTKEEFCECCGKPIKNPSYCQHCEANPNDEYYLGKYRQIMRGGELIPEHHYIYKIHYGNVPPNRIVHHLNGRRGDNRIQNLVAVKPTHHNSSGLLLSTQKRILELEKELGRS